jgi:Transposase and inactivated derivatives
LAVVDGYRESTQSWRELLQQLKRQGLQTAPKLAIGDGSLGFWLALREEYGPVAQQRCRVHKTANLLRTIVGPFGCAQSTSRFGEPCGLNVQILSRSSTSALAFGPSLYTPRPFFAREPSFNPTVRLAG